MAQNGGETKNNVCDLEVKTPQMVLFSEDFGCRTETEQRSAPFKIFLS